MGTFNDEFGDLSGYKILSFEEVTQGFEGNKNPLHGIANFSKNEIEYKEDQYINLNKLLDDINISNNVGNGSPMQYTFNGYFQDTAQTYIMNGEIHIDVSAKIGLKNGIITTSQKFSRDRPYMEVYFDEEHRLTYSLTFLYTDTRQTAIELKTHAFADYKNLLLYIGYGNVETERDASAFFIREFTDFLKQSESAEDLYKVYGDLPESFIKHIFLSTETVANHLKILAKEDDTGWFSWTKDTSSLFIKVLAMFRNFKETGDFFWKNPKFITEIYDNLDGTTEIFGMRFLNRRIFASMLNHYAKSTSNAKAIITKNALFRGKEYFVETNITELNDTLNTIKGILSFDWDFDYKNSIFLQQKRTVTKAIEQQETDEFGKGGVMTEETKTEAEAIDPGYLYHPMHLVHYMDRDIEGGKAQMVTALFIKAIADEKEWEEVMRDIRIGTDIIAIIAGILTMGLTGEVSAIAIADITLASIDLSLMNEDVKKWLSQSPEGKWFVDNWDIIYGLVGAGMLSVVLIDGILTHGPTLLEKLKNLKNVKGNFRIFTEQLEKLITELDAYQVRNATNVIEEVTLVGEKNGLLKKLLKLVSSPEENLQFIVEDIANKGLSVRKVAENEYEVLYKGQILKTGKDSEIGAFLKKYFWKSVRQVGKEVLKDIIRTIYSQLGELRTSAREILINEDILINYKKGLQSSKEGLFKDVKLGEHKDESSKYLWTIDKRGINLAYELTPFPTTRGNIVHSNLSKSAYIAGEAWFISEKEIVINAGSGRFGYNSGATIEQWEAAIKFWETLGYEVNAIPFNER
ncbi:MULTISPECIES: hypothetical protein [unclassified Chryseobacterium]|uniref:hypothetical protein n=1 Tax=unclassified Chryseobacterium TaxID=2593645 RepID=UPI000D363B15|nr:MULTISPECIES: hypothetical protein [unclassified Chryseobacterium]PTT77864.1 hypothetical protein DBR25_01840 [Chryseobacterium sp. HMWF001]PVV60596.1 hypothetical protein DD829_04555 [Chryseobacterium sp. HMWF035]